MSRISQLKETIEINQARIVNCTQFIKEAKDELSALEAREKKPKEYVIAVTDTGQIYGQWTDIPYGSKFERITVIEKLPVKVTREMVAKMQKIYWGVVTPPDNMAQWVEVLKAAGIDAEPSND